MKADGLWLVPPHMTACCLSLQDNTGQAQAYNRRQSETLTTTTCEQAAQLLLCCPYWGNSKRNFIY